MGMGKGTVTINLSVNGTPIWAIRETLSEELCKKLVGDDSKIILEGTIKAIRETYGVKSGTIPAKKETKEPSSETPRSKPAKPKRRK